MPKSSGPRGADPRPLGPADPRGRSTPASEAWRQRFSDFEAAEAAHDRAQACVHQLEVRLAASATDGERAALKAGLAVAERRSTLAGRTLAVATNAFTEGRSVLEAIWDAPDDI